MDTPAPAIANAISTIQTDTYCATCGFNLHTQPVWKDERLGILLARCPECGQHHPAGNRTTATNAWLTRLAFVGFIAYILLGLGYVFVVFFGLFGTQMSAVDVLLTTQFQTKDGREVQWIWGGGNPSATTAAGWYLIDGPSSDASKPTAVPSSDVVRVEKFPYWLTGGQPSKSMYNGGSVPIWVFVLSTAFFGLCIYVAATILGTISWFWPARRQILWFLLPVAATVMGVLAQSSRSDRYNYSGTPVPLQGASILNLVLGATLVFEVIIFAVAIYFARPVARLIVRLFLPTRARQLFAFLWLRDGLQPSTKP